MTGSSRSEKDTSKRRGAPKGSRRRGHGIRGGSSEANRLAMAILEVLAGVCTPADAAAALKISLPRYYILEKRALDGLVAACEPKPLGKQPSLETRIAALEKALQKTERECARQQALVRVARRSVGLSVMGDASATGVEEARPPGPQSEAGHSTGSEGGRNAAKSPCLIGDRRGRTSNSKSTSRREGRRLYGGNDGVFLKEPPTWLFEELLRGGSLGWQDANRWGLD